MTKRNGKKGKRDAGHPGVQSVRSENKMGNCRNETTGSSTFWYDTVENWTLILIVFAEQETFIEDIPDRGNKQLLN